LTPPISEVNFTNILRSAFACPYPTSTKRHWQLDCLFALLGSSSIKTAHKHIGEIDPNSQFLQFTGAKYKCASARSLAQSVSPTTLCQTLPVNTTRIYAQLLHLSLYAVHNWDHWKFTGLKAACRMLLKLTPGYVNPTVMHLKEAHIQ